jgi:hypothetical protein
MVQLLFMGLGVVVILFALYLYQTRARNHAKAVAALAWPRTRGRVASTSIGTTTIPSGDPAGDTPAFVPQVAFAYEVSGTTYQGSRVSYADLKERTKQKVVDFVARYPVGADIQISYDPANPAESVLEPSTKGTNPFNIGIVFLLAAGAACLLGGIYLQLTVR